MKNKRTTISRNSSTKSLAELVYVKAIKEQVEKRLSAKYLKRIDYLVGANNELMKELEQWERVRKVDELAPDTEVITT